MRNYSSALLTLQSDWPTLVDLDRAKAVRSIHHKGISYRDLAKALNRSEALLRHLLKTLQAPIDDQILARQKKISTNELVRRAEVAIAGRALNQAEARSRARNRSSIAGCKNICDWLVQTHLHGPSCEQIVAEARRLLAWNADAGTLPRGAAPVGKSTADTIKWCQPPQPKDDEISDIGWFGKWLALWAFYSMPDSWVRCQALELALEKQTKM